MPRFLVSKWVFNKQAYLLLRWGTVGLYGLALLACDSGRLFQDEHAIAAKRVCVSEAELADPQWKMVRERAQRIVAQGSNAGGHYEEVWIRDLSTFIRFALVEGDREEIRAALLRFFYFQGEDGNVPDAIVPIMGGSPMYKYRHSYQEPHYKAFKNTVETDQESSLIIAVSQYVNSTGDRSLLSEVVDGRTVLERLGRAVGFLLRERLSSTHGLLWGATTADWGDVQPGHPWGVEMDSNTHKAIDIYDNAMFILALQAMEGLLQEQPETKGGPREVSGLDAPTLNQLRQDIRGAAVRELWQAGKSKFRPHLYLNDSPFPPGFEEDRVYFHGGTAVALLAGVLSDQEAFEAYRRVAENVKKAGAQSIGLSLYPAYPDGFFENPDMKSYSYQNGGDWVWFGGRWVSALAQLGLGAQATQSMHQIVRMVHPHDSIYEWYSLNGQPRGARDFKGAAGVILQAFEDLERLRCTS
jgi:hypothetical protein